MVNKYSKKKITSLMNFLVLNDGNDLYGCIDETMRKYNPRKIIDIYEDAHKGIITGR